MHSGSSRSHRCAVEEGRRRIARGDRPRYHATVTTSPDGAADVRVRELPLVHLFAPADDRVVDAARVLIARMLGVDPRSFDVEVDPSGDGS